MPSSTVQRRATRPHRTTTAAMHTTQTSQLVSTTTTGLHNAEQQFQVIRADITMC